MKRVNTATLVVNHEMTECVQARSEVLLNEKKTGIVVSGQVLEGVVQIDGDRYLLFTTDDVVFEEFLTVTLISIERGVLESLMIGNLYSSGCFEDIHITKDDVRFHFIGDYVWAINVSDSPSLRLSFTSDPPGVKRKSRFKRYMRVTVEAPSG